VGGAGERKCLLCLEKGPPETFCLSSAQMSILSRGPEKANAFSRNGNRCGHKMTKKHKNMKSLGRDNKMKIDKHNY
jgi:hypothetical protein